MKFLLYAIVVLATLIGCVESEERSDEAGNSDAVIMEVADGVELPKDVLIAISAKATVRNLIISRSTQQTADSLEVMTGTFADGRGEVFRFVRDGEHWAFDSQSVWVE